jgi:hydrogenase-4 membrane subunit HyfE
MTAGCGTSLAKKSAYSELSLKTINLLCMVEREHTVSLIIGFVKRDTFYTDSPY